LVSRQFVEMPRTRIEGLLASFPKLMVSGQQHTTVETDTIRYLYQPIGKEMYAVLITTRQSNIVQDMDTLYLVARAVSDICDVSDQQDVVMHGFDIILAFDEIISQGYRDNVDLTKLRIILKMESHGERIQDTIERNKVRSAKQELKRQAKMFAQQRRETAKRGMPGLSGMGVGPGGTILGRGNMGSSYEPLLSREPEPARPFSSAAPGRSDSPSVSSSTRGMRMGRKPKGADIMDAMRNEIDLTQSLVENMSIADTDTAAAPGLSSTISRTAQPPVIPQIDMKGVHVQIEERITAVVSRDGGLEQMEVKGDLSLVISDATYANIQLRVATSNQHNAQVKTHPKVDKRRFHTDSVIALKDATSSFPL
ncbi:coatomer subunit delta, partial [Coemansia sp. RSA 2618]